MNRSLICYTEHGLAASTFCARVTASTWSDSCSSVLSGIGALKSSLHVSINVCVQQQNQTQCNDGQK